MKRLILFALLAGVALATPAQAQSAGGDAVRIHGSQHAIVLPAKPYPMFPGDFDGVKGTYDLSNGDVLVLLQKGKRMFAEMNDGARRELVAAGPDVFVALDREMQITLERGNFGGVGGELLMVAQDRQSQARTVQSYRLVAVR